MTQTTQSLKQKVQVLLKQADSGVINNFFGSDMNDEYADSRWPDEDHDNFLNAAKEAMVSFEHVANHGGEGEGEDFWSVYKFTDGTDEVYVQFDGWYQSYNGSEFNEFFFVKPQEVSVVQYFKDEE